MESAAEDGWSGKTNATSDLIKSLMGSQEAMATLAEALIPSLLLGLKSGEQLLSCSLDMQLHEKIPYKSAVERDNHNTTGSAAGSQNSSTAVSETSNAAGSEASNVAGPSPRTTCSNNATGTHPAGPSNATGPRGSALGHYPQYSNTSWGPPMALYFLPPPPQFFPWVHQPSNTENPGPPSVDAPTPSVSTLSDEEEDDVNPWLSKDEQGQLLSGLESEPDGEEGDKPPQPKRAKFMLQPRTVKILRAVTEQPVSNDKRRVITNKYPLPACDQAHTPKLDLDIFCIVPKSAISYDRFLSKLQQFSVDALGPLAWIHERLSGEETADPVQIKEAAKAAMALLGNAYAHMTNERRWNILKHLNKDLWPLAGSTFPNRGEEGGTKPASPQRSFSQRLGMLHRQAVSSHYGSVPSPALLPLSATAQTSSPQSIKLRPAHRDLDTSTNRPAVVDQPHQPVEWTTHPPAVPQPDNRNRCVQAGLGCLLQGTDHRRVLVKTGEWC